MLNLDRLTRTSILRHLYKQMGCEVNAKYNCIFTEDRILLTTYTRTKSWHFLKQTTAKTLSKKKDIEISVVPTYVQTTTHCYTTRNKICDTQSIVYNYWFFFSFFFSTRCNKYWKCTGFHHANKSTRDFVFFF